MTVTRVDHIELIVHHFDEYVALFRALGFQERIRTKHHGDSIEFQLPGENQPIFEIHLYWIGKVIASSTSPRSSKRSFNT